MGLYSFTKFSCMHASNNVTVGYCKGKAFENYVENWLINKDLILESQKRFGKRYILDLWDQKRRFLAEIKCYKKLTGSDVNGILKKYGRIPMCPRTIWIFVPDYCEITPEALKKDLGNNRISIKRIPLNVGWIDGC